jgi:hypothetical protein
MRESARSSNLGRAARLPEAATVPGAEYSAEKNQYFSGLKKN